MKVRINKSFLSLVVGDITKESADAIVNAANSGLRGGGGVDGAIHRAGGPSIMEACRKIGFCPTGSAVLTPAGLLKAKYVIHAVGPIYQDGRHDEAMLLRSAYMSCLDLASRHGIKSIAFPALSAGAYGYPVHSAARVALETVMEYLNGHPEIEVVDFVLFSQDVYEAFAEELQDLLPAI
ncbi:MAG: O-acetyl-ADP-ribose deacetylase [Deltaproteobacteria bacterium]|jgi:O-acetyl-ADP-ribose deacetylase (regulator of RNase III)|nr:O-acetyl-ADP-ribose deacetylase [Deltaproteobacteria bacterium]